MIDIGQGDSILIRYPHLKKIILVDTGGNLYQNTQVDHILIPYLKALGIDKLDLLILTHGDYDHFGNALELVQKLKVKRIFMNSGNDNELEQELIKNNKNVPIYQIDIENIKIGNQVFQFLNTKNSQNENEDSLIFFTQLNNKNILFMGDAGKKTELEILEEYNLPKMDILKVGHHGSKNSSDEEFLKVISPKIALISAGVRNRYSHPHQETIEKLKNLNSQILSTSDFGSVRLTLKKEIEVSSRFSK